VEIRRLEESHLAACVDIFNEAFNEVHRVNGFEDDVVDDDTWLLKPLRHFLWTDPEGGLVARDEHGEIAFASSVRRDAWWFLSFLFVRPRAQGQGVGHELIRRLMPQRDGLRTSTMVESFNTGAIDLYASEGMVPTVPKYWLTAPTDSIRLGKVGSLVRSDMTEENIEEIAVLDQEILGFVRRSDHRWWMRSMRGFVYRSGQRAVGYAYLDDGWIAPALAVDETTLVQLFSDVVSLVDKPEVETAFFGTSSGLFQTLMRAGFRIGPSTYTSVYASNAGAPPPSYILHSDWLP
jgi:GNAT superfamily N-acetyltransferase